MGTHAESMSIFALLNKLVVYGLGEQGILTLHLLPSWDENCVLM